MGLIYSRLNRGLVIVIDGAWGVIVRLLDGLSQHLPPLFCFPLATTYGRERTKTLIIDARAAAQVRHVVGDHIYHEILITMSAS